MVFLRARTRLLIEVIRLCIRLIEYKRIIWYYVYIQKNKRKKETREKRYIGG